ncbi:hypothetical protein Val02_67230 [Virgisporangium aliadipatigenens]|uniref:Uncharacterized protein n=1 Tax=Virgisporangium aliadipatigenens TaxID=741659 RepID=A0A8J3YST8_9ACTN|nr:hypothetical protein [Virgisporangium aliadipatigenens]GIJ49837.1 hypothetical protein Val02_67230 [Virgisporangium aliadipatigenens]
MSFAQHLRVLRDPHRPDAHRAHALRRCVSAYAPFGYTGTLEHLRERCGPLDTPAGLDAAAEALASSRRAWLAEVAAFAGQRRFAKGGGHRRASRAEVARYAAMGWPGDPGGTGARVLSPLFLRAYGIGLWEPAPVAHRRRVRRLKPSGEWPFTMVLAVLVAELLVMPPLGLGLNALLDPPPVFLWSFGLVALVVVPVLVVRQLPARWERQRAERILHRRIVEAAQDAERRLAVERARAYGR